MDNVEDLKYEFIFDEIFQASVRAALSTRNGKFPIYTKDIAIKKDITIKGSTLKSELKELIKTYVGEFKLNSFSEKKHYQKIEEIAETISNSVNCKHHLHFGKFRIGITQKILNLTLKYLWCAGVIEMPPHCPIDGVIRKCILTYYKDVDLGKWTEIDSKEEYYEYINTIDKIAKMEDMSIAAWELKRYHEHRPLYY